MRIKEFFIQIKNYGLGVAIHNLVFQWVHKDDMIVLTLEWNADIHSRERFVRRATVWRDTVEGYIGTLKEIKEIYD